MSFIPSILSQVSWHYFNANGEKVYPVSIFDLAELSKGGLLSSRCVIGNTSGLKIAIRSASFHEDLKRIMDSFVAKNGVTKLVADKNHGIYFHSKSEECEFQLDIEGDVLEEGIVPLVLFCDSKTVSQPVKSDRSFPMNDNTSSGSNAIFLKEEKKTVFEHVLRIGSIQKTSSGNYDPKDVLCKAKKHLGIVCNELDITSIQAVLLGTLFYNSDGDYTTIRELSDMMHCKPIEAYQFFDDLETLEEKGLIMIDRGEANRLMGRVRFGIPLETIRLLQKGAPVKGREITDKRSFFDMVTAADISEKNLFYPPKTAGSIQELLSLLQNENW